MSIHSSLKACLARATSERDMLSWIKRNPLVLSHAIGGAAFPNHVVAEFPFGSDFRADFVALGPFSGGWTVNFIELEPPNTRLFTSKGLAASRLNGAVSQISAWNTFIDKNRSTVVRDLSKYVQKRELVFGSSDEEPTDNCGWPLHHPKSWLIWHYYIVIGRRAALSEDDIERKSGLQAHSGVTVMTYDRLLDVAIRLKD